MFFDFTSYSTRTDRVCIFLSETWSFYDQTQSFFPRYFRYNSGCFAPCSSRAQSPVRLWWRARHLSIHCWVVATRKFQNGRKAPTPLAISMTFAPPMIVKRGSTNLCRVGGRVAVKRTNLKQNVFLKKKQSLKYAIVKKPPSVMRLFRERKNCLYMLNK